VRRRKIDDGAYCEPDRVTLAGSGHNPEAETIHNPEAETITQKTLPTLEEH
jgi:hypothetical protein